MAETSPTPAFRDLLRAFLRVGLLSFGGPAGQIALMHREIVEERGWVSEADYLHALNFCHLLPGPEAQQLATWIGWKLHGWKGGLAAGLLFVIPGALVILALSALYAAGGQSRLVRRAVSRREGGGAGGGGAGVAADRRAGAGYADSSRRLAVAAFAALFLLDLPFPLVVLGALALGMVVAAAAPAMAGAETRQRRPARRPAPLGRNPWRGAAVGRDLGRADGAGAGHAGHRSCAVGYRRVLLAAGGGDFRRGLCGAGLYGAGGGAGLRLAERGRDGRWAGPGGNHARPADHGNPVHRLPRRLPRARTLQPAGGGSARGGADHLGHLCAVFPVDLRAGPVDRPAGPCSAAQGRAGDADRRRGGGDRQSYGLVRAACAVCAGGRNARRPAAALYPGLGEL